MEPPNILAGSTLSLTFIHANQGYPTIKWFIDGEVASDYNGGRDA